MLYTIGFLLFSVFYLPTLLFKGRLHKNFLERFGIFDKNKSVALAGSKDAVWIQAVSVGEVALCKGLIPLLKSEFPGHSLVVSTITKTGNDLAKKMFSEEAVIVYFPLDLKPIVRKFLRLIRPKLYIMIETEIWPNLLSELSGMRTPSILVNGRISERSFGKYRLVRPFLKKTLQGISLFCMQSGPDAQRISYLGANPEKVRITGNMKFDAASPDDGASAQKFRDLLSLKAAELLLVAGSIHEGEEQIILAAFARLIQEFPDLRLLLAPRHVENAAYIGSVIKEHGYHPVLVSGISRAPASEGVQQVFILDTIGQLKAAYAAAAIVFVGGSLVKHGGQNPIEPAICEKPIMFGPHMFNFKDIASLFLNGKAAIQISDSKDLFDNSVILLRDSDERARLGKNAKKVALENRGAARRNIEAIKGII